MVNRQQKYGAELDAITDQGVDAAANTNVDDIFGGVQGARVESLKEKLEGTSAAKPDKAAELFGSVAHNIRGLGAHAPKIAKDVETGLEPLMQVLKQRNISGPQVAAVMAPIRARVQTDLGTTRKAVAGGVGAVGDEVSTLSGVMSQKCVGSVFDGLEIFRTHSPELAEFFAKDEGARNLFYKAMTSKLQADQQHQQSAFDDLRDALDARLADYIEAKNLAPTSDELINWNKARGTLKAVMPAVWTKAASLSPEAIVGSFGRHFVGAGVQTFVQQCGGMKNVAKKVVDGDFAYVRFMRATGDKDECFANYPDYSIPGLSPPRVT